MLSRRGANLSGYKRQLNRRRGPPLTMKPLYFTPSRVSRNQGMLFGQVLDYICKRLAVHTVSVVATRNSERVATHFPDSHPIIYIRSVEVT